MTLLRHIIVRKDLIIPSDSDSKRALLVGYLSLLCMAISSFYLIYNTILSIEDSLFAYLLLMTGSTVSLLVNRKGMHMLGKLVFLITVILIVFLFASQSHFETDTHFYYIIISISAFALFGYQQRWIAIAVTGITVALFIFGFSTGYSLLPDSTYPEYYIRSNQLINFVMGTIAASIVVHLMVKLNYMSEEKLKIKQQEITAQNEALQKANDELDRFVYSASHDLRAPLTSILGLTNLARHTNDPKEIEKCLLLINSRVHRLDQFIHDIIDFSRNSRTSVQKENISVLNTVESVLDGLKYSSTQRPIDINVDITPDLQWCTDHSRLAVILNNLVGNSIKYSDNSKESSFVRIGASTSPKGYKLSVADNGIGIPEEHLPRIFEMFYRATENSKGSGLGLYIVKETVEKLNGSIQFESVYGKGSEFTVILPY
ncbi:MAG TPA: HAMP domain-containing sensor histidine kinase [Ohtaekwangia sp.]